MENIRQLNKMINMEIKKVERFTLNVDNILEKYIDSHNDELCNLNEELIDKYISFINDKTIDNASKFINLYNLGKYSLERVTVNRSNITNELFTNKGLAIPLGKIKGFITFCKNNGMNKEGLIISGRLKTTTDQLFNYYINYYRDGINNNYMVLAEALALYSKDVSSWLKEDSSNEYEIEDIREIKLPNKIKTEKILDYRTMDIYMKGKGFEIVRYNGDHAIYSNGNVSIPVPVRTIGKGLSMKIQKQSEVV